MSHKQYEDMTSLHLNFLITGELDSGGLQGQIEYNADIFEAGQMARMAGGCAEFHHVDTACCYRQIPHQS